MAPPDFQRSRRILRRARIGDVLGFSPRRDLKLQRDRLLELLLQDSSRSIAFSELPEERVDIVVSLALAEVTEPAEDSLLVTLLCVQVLAADGQFARTRQLVDRLKYLAGRLEIDRPFLSITIRAFAETLADNRSYGARILAQRLGLSRRKRSAPVDAHPGVRQDILCATALRGWLGSADPSLLQRAHELILRSGNGLLLAFLDAALAYAEASHSADVRAVLVESDPTFEDVELTRYVGELPFKTLFPAQIEALHAGVTHDENHVVALPTSSGKTFLAQARIAASLTRHPGSKAVYVAPYRLLAHQVQQELSRGLRPLGITPVDIGSGYDPSVPDSASIEHADVLICTPEKLDALIRLAASSRQDAKPLAMFFERCKLLIFDELHLVGRPNRGPRFELLLTRISWKYPDWKVLGLCAATQGADALSTWLTGREAITQGRRPTGTIEIAWQIDGTLRQRVGSLRTPVGKLPRTGKALDDAATLVLAMREEFRPVLVIATSRPNAEGVASRLALRDAAQGRRWRENLLAEERLLVDSVVQEVRLLLGHSHKLAEYLAVGVAYHHAGVPEHLLRQIESLAKRQVLRALCSTTTVAEGSDLPFRAVVIPHLNFPGASGKLERDLYYNIIGRAGRANVAMEGMVFILESDAHTLHDLVPRSLWANTQADRVASRLGDVVARPTSIEDWETFTDIQGQVLAWLGESGNQIENQAVELGRTTLAGSSGNLHEGSEVAALMQRTLQSLEAAGMARAASPFRVTDLGELSRLGGLSADSTRRLAEALRLQRDGWMTDLVGSKELTLEQCELISALLFDSVEVLQQSLWLRRRATTETSRWEVLREIIARRRDWPNDEKEFQTDIALLANWINGAEYVALADLAPSYSRSNSLFGGVDSTKRTSDAAEYIGRITYPAAWTWSAIRVILGPLGESVPTFIRTAIETGAPSESASTLISQYGVTRPIALRIRREAGAAWENVKQWILDSDEASMIEVGIPPGDAQRLAGMRMT